MEPAGLFFAALFIAFAAIDCLERASRRTRLARALAKREASR